MEITPKSLSTVAYLSICTSIHYTTGNEPNKMPRVIFDSWGKNSTLLRRNVNSIVCIYVFGSTLDTSSFSDSQSELPVTETESKIFRGS